MVRCHFSFNSTPPAISFISSEPIFEKLNSISIIASLMRVLVSSPNPKASFWLIMSIRCCTSERSSGNFEISNFANFSFMSSSPNVRTILAIFLAAVSACFKSSNTALSSSVDISDENSSALLYE